MALSLHRFTVVGMFILLALSACKKDELQPEPDLPEEKGHSVFVLNEGNYQWGNASLSLIDLNNNSIQNDVFSAANNRPLGDVLQSATFINNEIWLVVNNSQRIERIDPKTAKNKGTINGLQSPRYVLNTGAGKAYVSDLYSGTIHCIDTSTYSITNSIHTQGWTEEMALLNGFIWVCNTGGNQVYKINRETDQIVDSISVGIKPRSIRSDKLGRIWVLCEGEIPPQESAGSLCCIDATTNAVIQQFAFPEITDHPSKLCINAAGDRLYFLNKGLHRMPITDASLPLLPFISQDNRLFYGLAIRPQDESIWLSDARDYVQQGIVYRYQSDGTLAQQWNAGVIPGGFLFY
jgi:DNA-binding beta-propeller fold protein YncE